MKSFSRIQFLLLILILISGNLFAQDSKDWLVKMQDPNVNFWELQKEFNDYWKDRTDTKGNGYKVFKRWEYINELRADPNGKLPAPDKVLKVYEEYVAEQAPLKSASGTWNLVGPTTYPTNITSQPTGKGRVNAIAFHPTDQNTIYIGSPSGGIWKTVNGGTNWINLSSNIPYLGVSAILIHPANPNIIYIGTGDRDGSDAPGIGVYKSTDGGATWVAASTGMGNATVGILLMHPSNPDIIIAATKSGIYKSTNGGSTWSLKISGDFRDLKFKPGDPNTVYATRMVVPSEFYRSTDNGDNWTLVSTPTSGVGSRMVIGVSPANPAYVYLVQIKNSDNTFKAFLKSTDSGLTFTEQSNSPNIFDYNCGGGGTASQATYDLCIEVDRTNADIVYVGSINTWKSVNGGVNWTPVTNWVGNGFSSNPNNNCAASVHADHHWMEWSPFHSPARLYLGHDGGISYTANGGTTWTEISSDLSTGQIYKIGQSVQAANTIVGGFQDNGLSATDDGTSFTTIGGGDGFDAIIDYNDPNYCYIAINGTVRRSTGGLFDSYPNISGGIGGTASFFSDYKLHHTDPNTMFFGRYDVWRTKNVRTTLNTDVNWTAISSFTGVELIRVMEQSVANQDMMYISRGSGVGSVLYRSDNINANSSSVVWNTIPKPNSNFAVSDIAAHPTNENIVFATAGTKVYRSANKGVSWTDITGNLPALFINCLIIDKNANEGIYIGNQTGVWYKDATMTDWILFSSGLPPVDVRELEIYYDANPDNNRIAAGTYGRGIWRSDLAVVNTIDPANLAATSVSSSQIDLSWTLNPANNNVLIATSPTTTFGVPADGTAYSAGNTLPGGGTVIYMGNLTNFSHTGLTPGTTYCYKIWSVNGSNQYSAGLTPVCVNTFSHNWTGNVNTDWFNPGNWGVGTVPTATDGAYIPTGLTNYPLINAAGATCNHLTIEAGASVAMDATTSYTLQVTGDWTNNGIFTRGVGTVEFNGSNALQTIKGTSTTAFYILNVNKGALGNILEATSLITLNAPTNPLVITSGTFKLSSASTITPFTSSAGATLSSGKGFWNNGGTINAGGFGWLLNAGLLRVSAGTVNVGTGAGNSVDYLNNGTLIMEGGALNIAARFNANNPASSFGQYTQTGGTLTVFTVGSSSTSLAPFHLSPNTSFTMSGGTIVVQRQSANTTGEVVINTTNHNVTGGTLQIGNTSTPAAQTIRINSTAPIYNLTVNATNAPTAQLFNNGLTVKNDLTISGGTLNANNLDLNVGGHWTNNGIFTPGAGTVTLNGTANQNLTGNNAPAFNNLTLNNAAGLTLSGSVNAMVNNTLTLTSGVITTGNNRVVIPASGTVARTSGHIFGNLEKNVATGANVSRTFEIGDAAAANYTPATVNFASVTTGGDLTARTISGDHPQIASASLNAARSVNRYWSLTNSGTAFTTYDAVFNFLSSDLDPSTNTNALIAGKLDGSTWTYPSIGARTANSTEITGATAFSDFQLAEQVCINPDVPVLAATQSTICSGQSITVSISSGNLNSATTWQWYTGSCGGTPVGTGTSLTVAPTTTTTYYARGEGGCVSPGSCGSVTITVNAPAPTIAGPSSVCYGGSVTLDAGAGFSTYSWDNSGGNAQTATFSNITGTTTYSVTVTDGNGCQGSDSHTVTVNSLPTPAISGLTAVCSGGSVTLDAGLYSAYVWDNGGGNAQTATFSNITGTTTYSVTVTDGNGCQGSDSHTVTVNNLPTPAISGLTAVCSGGSVTLDAGLYSAYVWDNGGGNAQTATFSNITSTTTYSVTVTDANGCQGSDSHTVTVNSLPTPTISGSSSVCSGGSVTLDAGVGYNAYAWSNGGGSAQSATFSNITSTTTYSVTVTDANGCEGSDSHIVTVNNVLTPVITGPTSVCSGGSVTLNAGAGYASYTWDNSGGNAQSATFSNISSTTTYSVTVTDANGCQGSDSHTVTVNSLPTPTISGLTAVCSGGSVTLDAGLYSAYVWDNGGGNAQTATFSNITGTTTYSVTVTDGNGCQGSDSHTVTVNNLPTPAISGLTAVCSGGSVTLNAGAGYASYTWDNSGGNAQSATFSNITSTTTYSVTVTDGNGCQGSDSHTVTVDPCNNLEFSGTIKWHHDGTSGINNATVNLTGPVSGSDLTDANGDYLIAIPATSGNFVLTPVKNTNKLNGVTSADATAIQQHVAGITPITNLYRVIAADVNKSNSITTLDATVINQSLLGNPSALAQFKTSWRFVPQTYVLNNPPWGFAENISMTGVSTNQTGKNFYGIKTGDIVTTYANPANFGAGEPLVLRVQDRWLETGAEVVAEFRADQLNDLNALQMALRFDPAYLELSAVEPLGGLPLSGDNFGTFDLASGEIRVVWSNVASVSVDEAAPLFRLRFNTLQGGALLGDVLRLDADVLPALAYNSALAESGVELAFSETTHIGPDPGTSSLWLYASPNPFRHQTVLHFELPEAGEAEWRVYDVSGRLLKSVRKNYSEGVQKEVLELDDTAVGVLFVELLSSGEKVTRRLIRID